MVVLEFSMFPLDKGEISTIAKAAQIASGAR
jgi:hypothetical protein